MPKSRFVNRIPERLSRGEAPRSAASERRERASRIDPGDLTVIAELQHWDEKRAKYLAQMTDVSESIATHALIAYHFAAQRPLMGAFLDAVGIPHEDGLISAEQVDAPSRATLTAAAEKVQETFATDDLEIYLKTLLILDGETWKELDTLLPLAKA